MKIKPLTKPVLNYSLAIALSPRAFPGTHLIQACSRDYGFDFDEEELGRKMLAPLPIQFSSQVTLEVNTHEFEQVLQCFLL